MTLLNINDIGGILLFEFSASFLWRKALVIVLSSRGWSS